MAVQPDIDLAHLAWDCDARCFCCLSPAGAGAATEPSRAEQSWERPLRELINALLNEAETGDPPLSTPQDLIDLLVRLQELLDAIGLDTAELQERLLHSAEFHDIAALVAQGVTDFEERQGAGAVHSVIGRHSVYTWELFELAAAMIVACVVELPAGAGTGIVAFVWLVTVLRRYRFFANTRERELDLFALRRNVERVIRASDEDLEVALGRLRTHLFARAKIAAMRGCV